MTDLDGYGGFRLGDLHLALPMAALREVLPCASLLPLPCTAPGLLGGLDLRGSLLPVVGLHALLGRTAVDGRSHCVLVLCHAGRLLGLQVDDVTGVFRARHAIRAETPVDAGQARLFAGSVRREDDGALVSLLSLDTLVSLPGVPLIEDPEPARQHDAQAARQGKTADARETPASLPLLLMRAGAVHLAIDALAVHTTLSHPQVEPSVLARGACLGVIAWGGQRMPLVDLLALCGLGQMDPDQPSQAFVVRMPSGLVGLQVTQVLDVVAAPAEAAVPVPAFALPRASLFAGALPADTLHATPASDQASSTPAAPWPAHYLLLDSAALRACSELVALAQTCRPDRAGEDPDPNGGSTARKTAGRSMITYDLGQEAASPIEQVSEILPCQPEANWSTTPEPLLGLTVSRGRAIPVLCLRRLLGAATAPWGNEGSVLVVQSAGQWLGFAVPRLRSIEASRWEPPPAGPGAAASRRLVQIEDGDGARMLPLIDLGGLAASLQQH